VNRTPALAAAAVVLVLGSLAALPRPAAAADCPTILAPSIFLYDLSGEVPTDVVAEVIAAGLRSDVSFAVRLPPGKTVEKLIGEGERLCATGIVWLVRDKEALRGHYMDLVTKASDWRREPLEGKVTRDNARALADRILRMLPEEVRGGPGAETKPGKTPVFRAEPLVVPPVTPVKKKPESKPAPATKPAAAAAGDALAGGEETKPAPGTKTDVVTEKKPDAPMTMLERFRFGLGCALSIPGWTSGGKIAGVQIEVAAFITRRMAVGIGFGFFPRKTENVLPEWPEATADSFRLPIDFFYLYRFHLHRYIDLEVRGGLRLEAVDVVYSPEVAAHTSPPLYPETGAVLAFLPAVAGHFRIYRGLAGFVDFRLPIYLFADTPTMVYYSGGPLSVEFEFGLRYQYNAF